MFEPEDSWHEFEAMIDEFSDSEVPNETAATETVLLDWKDNDSDSELYFSDSAMSEDSQLNLKLISYSCATDLAIFCDIVLHLLLFSISKIWFFLFSHNLRCQEGLKNPRRRATSKKRIYQGRNIKSKCALLIGQS